MFWATDFWASGFWATNFWLGFGGGGSSGPAPNTLAPPARIHLRIGL